MFNLADVTACSHANMQIGLSVVQLQLRFAYSVGVLPFELGTMWLSTPAQRAIRGIVLSNFGERAVIFAAFGRK